MKRNFALSLCCKTGFAEMGGLKKKARDDEEKTAIDDFLA